MHVLPITDRTTELTDLVGKTRKKKKVKGIIQPNDKKKVV